MNDPVRWLMIQLIILNLLAFAFGALFGINLERLQKHLEKKDLDEE